jgi:hypothetical protein
MFNISPPAVKEVYEFLKEVRWRFDYVAIGCMRPYGKYRESIDKMALEIGVNSIVNPSKACVGEASSGGFDVENYYECCAFDALSR